MDSIMYWLQVGVYLQLAGKSGEMTYWYTNTGNMANFLMGFKLLSYLLDRYAELQPKLLN